MSWPEHPDRADLDLVRDVPTSAQDVDAFRRLRRETPSWFSLTPEDLEALRPEGAIERRPPIRADATPFTLP